MSRHEAQKCISTKVFPSFSGCSCSAGGNCGGLLLMLSEVFLSALCGAFPGCAEEMFCLKCNKKLLSSQGWCQTGNTNLLKWTV